GVTDATGEAILIRKYSVKTGNLDFANARGIGEDDSEWIVVLEPNQNSWRDVMWTVGNHGDYHLDENTLISDVANVDFEGKTITVPWGTRRADGVMELMEKKPGIAWIYHVAPVLEDSASFAAYTGDQLEVIVAGNVGEKGMFDIIVADPTADANMVVPVSPMDGDGFWRDANDAGILSWPRVTTHKEGNDTIWGIRGGIPYATRTDSLLARLEKPANATWEFEFVGGTKRADLVDGDMLKVTASNGTVKSYYIAVTALRKNDQANLFAITWPDIPEFYYGIFGWIGDTIPGFGPTLYNYRVQVPLDVAGIPALVGKPESTNAKVDVKRATSLSGTTEDRTITFTVTAEDDTTVTHYNVELVKEKNPVNVQPYHAEPFLSELVFWESWSNSFGEICNPGNQPLDLSNYMIAMAWNTDPAGVIQSRMDPGEWLDRFDKYVPGYKWVDEATWQVTPGILVQDVNVNPIVMPGDVFAFGGIWQTAFIKFPWGPDYVWPVPGELDVQFNNIESANGNFYNPWGEDISGNGSPIRKWYNSNWYMFKILNDSIKKGQKPANDPNDFELIESFGMIDGTSWVLGGVPSGMITSHVRKPEIYTANPAMQASFGTSEDDTEWLITNAATFNALGYGWPYNILAVGYDIGKHFFNTPTHFMSTVGSVVYKVSEGYSMNEDIRGPVTGVTANEFLANIIKADEKQTLTLKATADGSELTGGDVLSINDTLVVMSADSTNTSKYIIEVTDNGLSSDALLTSNKYTIEVQSDPKSANEEAEAGAGTVTGFEYGTSLKTIIANITAPAGANYDIVDGNGAYVPLQMMNFDTTYVNVTVNSNTYIEVTAENGVTKILYQLIPDVSDKDAFITSNVYDVVQKDVLIHYVPRGTDVRSFLSNLVVSAGASMVLVDKFGLERVEGYVADDDKVIVTSPNGEVTKVYFISMLAEKYVPETTYLAYITSKVYQIGQVDYVVDGVDRGESISGFYSNITPSMGAAAVLVDKDGNEKTSGDVESSDKVQVTSADGKVVVMYTIAPLTSTDIVETHNIQLYPNPTNGNLNISGLEQGNRVQVFNTNGSAIRDIIVGSSIEVVSLHKEPAGMYMIVISDNSKLLGRYKAIKN
ncbi:MAG: T9SS type A sorting domain-containing protein, partial [Draconibacterium sp.]|nr:T9SS type A sorting domain-containing protein [Draconibacterium sp.]